MSTTSSTEALFQIITKINKYKSSNDFYSAWRQIFSSKDNLEVLREVGLLFSLVDSAAKEADSFTSGFSGRSTTHWRNQILTALTTVSAHNSWEKFRTSIDSHSIGYLELQANLVGGRLSDLSVSDEKLGEALVHLNAAIGEVGSSSLSSEVKLLLLRRLRELIAAIEDYGFTGNPALFDQLKATTFDLAAVRTINPEINEIDELEKGLSILANAMAVASSLKGLAKPALKLLGIES